MNTRIINCYGGPGTGKSTTMAALFVKLKRAGRLVEMSPEWVKGPVWGGELHVLQDQPYIFTKQARQLNRLVGNVEFVVTDAPLLMGLVYSDRADLHKLIREEYGKFDNVDVFLRRTKLYVSEGRTQDEVAARVLDGRILAMLANQDSCTFFCDANETAEATIMGYLGIG